LPGGCAASSSFSTAWRLFCPAGSERSASSFPLRNGFCLAPRVRGLSALARPRSRCAETPPAAIPPVAGQRVSGRGPLGVRKRPRHRYPSRDSRAGSPQPPEVWPLAPAGRFETPTLRLETLKPGPSCSVAGPIERFNRERGVVGRSAPRARRAMAPKRAGTERPDRRVETLDPTERLIRGRGTARVRMPGCVPPQAGSHAKAGRRAGPDAQPERPLEARGAKNSLTQ
jgi:hypothetical protein